MSLYFKWQNFERSSSPIKKRHKQIFQLPQRRKLNLSLLQDPLKMHLWLKLNSLNWLILFQEDAFQIIIPRDNNIHNHFQLKFRPSRLIFWELLPYPIDKTIHFNKDHDNLTLKHKRTRKLDFRWFKSIQKDKI